MNARSSRSALLVSMLLFALSPRAHAAPPAPPATPANAAPQPTAPAPAPQVFSEQVLVNVVNLDVYVADSKGHPITDLKREDFQVLEDGKPVEVTNFYNNAGGSTNANASPAAVAAAGKSRPEEQRLSLVVFVDDVNTEGQFRNRILESLTGFLQRELAPGDRVMLVRYQTSVDVRRSFTTDLGQIERDIAALEKLSAHGHDEEIFRQANEEIREASAISFGTGCDQALEQTVKTYADSQNHLLDSALRALDSVVSAIAPVPGRKAVLYVGDGFSANPGSTGFQKLASCLKGTVISGFVSARTYDSRARFDEVTGHASRNRVAFYTMETSAHDATGLEARDDVDNQESLRRLAEGTGGRAILEVSDPRLALSLLADDLGNYYSLGYRPTRAADGVDHKIEVKVKRSGAHARYRPWYRDKPQGEVVAERTAAAMLYGFEDNPLGASVEIGRQVPQGDLFVVPVRLHVPFAKLTLLPRDGARVGHVRFFVVASGNGTITPVRSSEADIRSPTPRPPRPSAMTTCTRCG